MGECLTLLKLRQRYSTNHDDLVGEFYGPALENSSSYDRAVGYFHSSILLLAIRPVAGFAKRGGKIRLICSPELTESDIAALGKGYELRLAITEALSRIIDQALEDPTGRPVVEFLATLVANCSLDVRIALRPGARGIFHDKIGIFGDRDSHKVSFTGSVNETFYGWHPGGNHESFDVFCSWTPDEGRVTEHVRYFERLWEGREPGVDITPFPDVAREKLVVVANPNGIDAAYERLSSIETVVKKRPQPHQSAAIESWERAGRRGILEHATGSGKTYTAILAMRAWLSAGRVVLIVVPTEILLHQWQLEITSELVDISPQILLVGAGHDRWRQEDVLEGFSRSSGRPRIILGMLQTVSSPEFLRGMVDGGQLLLIADEVHRVGSPKFSSLLTIDAAARLGLSATPVRYGDPEGSSRILDYFGPVIQPPFTLSDAIAAGRLCHYNYYVHPLHLEAGEAEEWRRFTKLIGREIAQTHGDTNRQLSDRARLLLIQRARILKGAAGKVILARDLLLEEFQDGQRWLIYCDDQHQLAAVMAALKDADVPAEEYHSAMPGHRQATLENFSIFGGIIVAIRCLDEGVDIPATDHALILASSRNPREFIQRRGRVLRTSPGKYFAEIHDALVLPPVDASEPESSAILQGELARAVQFAANASNDAVKFELRQLAREAGVDPSGAVSIAGFEDEEGVE